MADSNGESRKWLTINTAIFGGASLALAIVGIGSLIKSFLHGHIAMPLVGAILGLGVFGKLCCKLGELPVLPLLAGHKVR